MSESETLVQMLQKKRAYELEIRELNEKMSKGAPQFFQEATKPLFEKHPRMKRFNWTQYTPEYCDGDPCEFNSDHESPNINGEYVTEHSDPKSTDPEIIKAAIDVRNFMKIFTQDDMYEIFGDGASVTVTRAGLTVSGYNGDEDDDEDDDEEGEDYDDFEDDEDDDEDDDDFEEDEDDDDFEEDDILKKKKSPIPTLPKSELDELKRKLQLDDLGQALTAADIDHFVD
jgi:hypothetical protein